MDKPKLTIEHLKNYLGTGLKILDGWGDVRLLKYTHLDDDGNNGQIFQVKPICYRLSDLDKFIPELGFCPKDEFFIRYGGGVIDAGKSLWKEIFIDNIRWSPVDTISFGVVQLLFQWHFWPFDQSAFDEGLVIDKLQYGKEVSHG